jgi:hypothetical protein
LEWTELTYHLLAHQAFLGSRQRLKKLTFLHSKILHGMPTLGCLIHCKKKSMVNNSFRFEGNHFEIKNQASATNYFDFF